MSSDIALCSIVTESVLEEFFVLKFSYELFHGDRQQWFIRCDRASAAALRKDPRVSCHVFADREAIRPENESEQFRRIVAEKMNALADAWAARTWDGVAFLDADLIFTDALLPVLAESRTELVLTPNYYPPSQAKLAAIHGVYNSGFIFTRTAKFHGWWRHAFETGQASWTDQASLTDAPDCFSVGTLDENANVGFWRSVDPPLYRDVPSQPALLHVHLYQPLASWREWIDKSFALHCVKWLHASPRRDHARLVGEILNRDPHRWYEATLTLCGVNVEANSGA